MRQKLAWDGLSCWHPRHFMHASTQPGQSKSRPTVARGRGRRQWRRNDLLALVRDKKLTMPPDQAMLLKVFVSLDSAFKKLDPGFDVMVAMQPTLHEAVIDQLSPLALGKRGQKVFTQYVELFADLPKEIGRGLYTARVR